MAPSADDEMDEFFEKKRRQGAGAVSKKVYSRESKCTTHHHACDCREAKIARMVLVMRELSRMYYQGKLSMPLYEHKHLLELEGLMEEWEGEYEE